MFLVLGAGSFIGFYQYGFGLKRKEMQMKTDLQHILNPLKLWSRFGGNFTQVFKLYETYCWKPFLRRWLSKDLKA
jgi:hypothetical protein